MDPKLNRNNSGSQQIRILCWLRSVRVLQFAQSLTFAMHSLRSMSKNHILNEKIEEAEFFLNKIKKYYNCFPESNYYLSAFLTSSRSIPDYLLEEYQIKYNLGISLDVSDLRNQFIKKATKLNNHDAIDFYHWFKKKLNYISTEDNIGSIFVKNRNLNTHRTPTRSAIVVNANFPDPRNPISDATPKDCPDPYIALQDIPNMSIEKACEYFFNLMKDLVNEAQAEFKIRDVI